MNRIIAGALLSGAVALSGFALATGTAQAFNPQPDPPGKHAPTAPAFNPQPDPPGKHHPARRG
jgi:hypothetical protein